MERSMSAEIGLEGLFLLLLMGEHTHGGGMDLMGPYVILLTSFRSEQIILKFRLLEVFLRESSTPF